MLLCERLRKDPSLVIGRRVLEVGAGCGVCSFLVGRDGYPYTFSRDHGYSRGAGMC